MSKTTVYNMVGEKVREVQLDPKIFGVEVRPEVLHQAAVAQRANARKVIAHAKDRSEVRGGGKKPWRQKGTGRARHGSSRSPIWRGGGVTFGPSNKQNFSQKINRKVKKKAILMCLSDKALNNKITLLDDLKLEKIKTKDLFKILQNLSLRDKPAKAVKKTDDKKPASKSDKVKKDEKPAKRTKKKKSVLVVLSKSNPNIQRSARNIARVDSISANSLNVTDLLKYENLVMPLEAIKTIEKTFVR